MMGTEYVQYFDCSTNTTYSCMFTSRTAVLFTMSFSDAVQAISEETLRVSAQAVSKDVLLCTVRTFEPSNLESVLNGLEHPFRETQTPADSSDADERAFHSHMLNMSKDFVLFAGVQQCIDQLLKVQRMESVDETHEAGEKSSSAESETISHSNGAHKAERSGNVGELPSFDHLFTCLDFILGELAPTFEIVRRQFFALIETVCDQLLRNNPRWAAHFWQYMETRSEDFQNHVFSAGNTANRIAVLGLCNHVTDLYYERNSEGEYDSYRKDSFSDNFHARVRSSLAKMLDFEDLTGLNKYFATANRKEQLPQLSAGKSGDEELLKDIFKLQRTLRNPYLLLKNPRELVAQADSLSKLNAYLLSEEAKYAKVHPPRDIYRVQEHSSDLEGLKWFFPEAYWLSAFDEDKKDLAEKFLSSDKRFGTANLDSSKYRKLVIVQIYLVCNFFLEVSPSSKKEMLVKIGAKPNTKHIVEDGVPDHIALKFSKIKNDTLKLVRLWDMQLNFFLMAIAQSEENWMGWLIYGKDKSGTGPLLDSRKNISDSDIARTQEKYHNVFKFKSKRYFNTHVTPQLSRRMKTPTGLHGLRVPDLTKDYEAEILALAAQIKEESDLERKAQLHEDRIILIWKSVKGGRSQKWLQLDASLDTQDFAEEKEDAKIEEAEKVESQNVNGEEPTGKEIGEPELTGNSQSAPEIKSYETEASNSQEAESVKSQDEFLNKRRALEEAGPPAKAPKVETTQ